MTDFVGDIDLVGDTDLPLSGEANETKEHTSMLEMHNKVAHYRCKPGSGEMSLTGDAIDRSSAAVGLVTPGTPGSAEEKDDERRASWADLSAS